MDIRYPQMNEIESGDYDDLRRLLGEDSFDFRKDTIPVSKIRVNRRDAGYRARRGRNSRGRQNFQQKVINLKKAIANSGQFTAIALWELYTGRYIILDGHHRFEAVKSTHNAVPALIITAKNPSQRVWHST